MQSCPSTASYHTHHDLLTSETLKSMTVDNYPQDVYRQSSFLKGLHNARSILNDLQESIKETRVYESQLRSCRNTHAHKHTSQFQSGDDQEQNDKEYSSQSQDPEPENYDVSAESWSAMTIVCLQYQYQELSKRYKSLLDKYDQLCGTIHNKNEQLEQVQELAKNTHAQLVEAHTALLAVGEKYMALRQRKQALKRVYSRRVYRLKRAVKKLIEAADRSRDELDDKLKRAMKIERHGETALLLAEIQKCNRLCLENLRLKAQIQELIPLYVPWDYETY